MTFCLVKFFLKAFVLALCMVFLRTIFTKKTKVLSLQGGFKMIGFISWGGKVLQYKWLFVFKSFFSRLLFWLYAWWLYVRFSPKKRRCCLFKEALKWAVAFLEVVRFYNINEFLFSKNFSLSFCFGSMHGNFTRDFHLKNENLKT